MTPEHVKACDVSIAKGWEYVTDRDSAAVDVLIASEVGACTIDFFAEIDDAAPVLHLEGVELEKLRFTREGSVVEFWFSGEHVNEGGIHDFMKPYAYTRVWAAFAPSQGDLQLERKKEKSKPAAQKRLKDPG